MSQKIAVALIHGIGKQDENFAHQIIYELKKQFAESLKKLDKDNLASQLVVEPVYWAPVLQKSENKLWDLLKEAGSLNFNNLRRLMIDFAGDAIAYQPILNDRTIYDGIHKILAKTIDKLSHLAGQQAPLCVIGHSLGTVIASNYIYDLQNHTESRKLISDNVLKVMDDTPIENGWTFCKFFTLGSPLAIWSLRYHDFGKPIQVPSPQFSEIYPGIEGEWINYYDKDDIIGYPLKTLNKDYKKTVTSDIQINVGNFLMSWNPASHMGYWNDNDVINPIARSLADLWLEVNKL
jgi:hypothetical protein